jgi:gamma-glutamylcyclotransferase (GGCT)/AIG2-like uncharacterized protein YtfP
LSSQQVKNSDSIVKPRNINVINRPTAHLFVYGTLVEPRRLAEVLGHRPQGQVLGACLRGFRRVTTPTYEFPFVVPDPTASVDGVLVMDLDAEDLRRLDQYEDVADGLYRRVGVDVEVWGGGPTPATVRADTYAAGPGLLNQ